MGGGDHGQGWAVKASSGFLRGTAKHRSPIPQFSPLPQVAGSAPGDQRTPLAAMSAAVVATLPTLLLLLGLAAADCPSSTWVQFQSNCYIFLQTTVKIENIEDVRNQCTDSASGADMISIHNEEENAFILETYKKQWKGQDDILLGMFYDTDDESFKWYDKSNMTFNKWKNSEESQDLIDTCGFLQTKSGIWKKGNCEVSSVEGALCKAAVSYEKKYLPDNHILITALVIASTTILTITGAVVWFLYKRNLTSGFTNTAYTTAPQLPYNDDCILVDAEENEYVA